MSGLVLLLVTGVVSALACLLLRALLPTLQPVKAAGGMTEAWTAKFGKSGTNLGGMAIAIAMLMGFVLVGQPLPIAIVVALVGALLLGLAHDIWGVPVGLRLVVETGLGAGVVAAGFAISAIPGPAAIGMVAGIIYFVVAVNAVRLADVEDGLAAGAAVLSALGLAVITARFGGPGVVAIVLAGGGLGFLVLNAPPAALSLGANGAYLLGAGLSVVAIATARTVPMALGVTTCFGIFFLDLLLAGLRKTVGRSRVTAGDRGHLTDQLLGRGLTITRALLVSYLLQCAFILAGIAMTTGRSVWAGGIFVATWGIALIVLLAGGFVRFRIDA